MFQFRAFLATIAVVALTVLGFQAMQQSAAATNTNPPTSCSATWMGGTVDYIKWTRSVDPSYWHIKKVGGGLDIKVPGSMREYADHYHGGKSAQYRVASINNQGVQSTWCTTKLPSPSPTPTRTPTPTPTTATPTPTPTTQTPTPTPTTETPTPTQTTETPTPTPTTETPTPTPTQTSTPPTGACFDYEAGAYLCSAPGAVQAGTTTDIQNFLSSVGANYPKLNGLGTNKWGMVYGVGTASDPVYKLTGNMPSNVANQLKTIGFHAPASFADKLTGTSDSPFVVVDKATGISIWGAGASKVNDTTINVTSAGYFTHGTNGLDSKSIGGKSDCPAKGVVCTVSRGRIPEAFLVTSAEFATADANHTGLGHVLELFWPETDSSGCKLPMSGCESGNSGVGIEGQRIALDPTIDIVDRPGCSNEADVIVRTLQQNGAYIGDNAGGNSLVIKAEQGGSFPNLSQNELQGCVTASDFVATTDGPFN